MLRNREKRAPGLDITVFEQVVDEGGVAKRRALACQLAKLVIDEQTPVSEKRLVTPVLLRLAMDPVKDIRVELARVLTPAKDLDPDLVFTIIADDEDIALPFLARSPALDASRMMAVFRVGDVARRKTLAGRGDIDAKIIEEIALKGEKGVAVALLDNARAELDNNSCKRLYVRFRDVPEVVDRLLERPDLPLEIRIAHVRVASDRLQRMMKQRGWIAANDADEVVVEAEENALVRILAQARDAESLARAIAFMSRRNVLTPSVILRAACHGHVMVLEHALAFLAGLPAKKARGLVLNKGVLSLRAVYNRTGLPANCFMLVRAIADAARELGMDGKEKRIVAPADFGRVVLRRLASDYDMLSVEERAKLVELLARFSDEETRELARRLGAGLKRAA